MGIVDDLTRMKEQMATDRSEWESVWREVISVAMPYASHRFDLGGKGNSTSTQKPMAVSRGRELFDPVAAFAADRLVAGMESLITPRAQKWHTFSLDDPFAPDPTDVEEEWLDRLRDYHFAARYDAKSNFSLANQKSIRSACVLGTGVTFLDENTGRRGVDPVKVPFFYRNVPLIDAYLGIDAFDDVDKCIQVSQMTARAAAAFFDRSGDKMHERMRKMSEAAPDELCTVMHAVLPREEAGEYKDKRKNMPYASFWVDIDNNHLIRSSGYFTFPYEVKWWDQIDNCAYGQSPVMTVLANVKMLQVMGKAAAQVSQQLIKPPMATMPGIYNQRLNLNAGAVNAGYLDENGRLKAQPLIQAQNPSFAERLIESNRAGVNEGMYVNIFQILVQSPQMTATEAIIRSNEKGEMLGPAGAKIEAGIARSIDREVDIVQRKGAFEQGSPLEPPASIGGKNIGVSFTGPLARLRRMAEFQGVQSVLQVASVIGQYDQSIVDRIDGDETLELSREIGGAPRKMFRTDAEVAERRQQRIQQQEQAAALQAGQAMSQIAKDAAPAAMDMARANGMMPA